MVIFQALCTFWKVENPDHFALQYTEPPTHYVTEKNRSRIKVSTSQQTISCSLSSIKGGINFPYDVREMQCCFPPRSFSSLSLFASHFFYPFQDGTVLLLIYSASKTADDILHKLKKGILEEKRDALTTLVKMSSDFTFAHEFIAKQVSFHILNILILGEISYIKVKLRNMSLWQILKEYLIQAFVIIDTGYLQKKLIIKLSTKKISLYFQGISLLISHMESPKNEPVILPYMLTSFLELMDHGIMPWDDLQPPFIEKVRTDGILNIEYICVCKQAFICLCARMHSCVCVFVCIRSCQTAGKCNA